jgi:UDP-GlcNAc:undecaprenyl-phosphate/decaprenyl-phosphate GlcNAc-1-phosphate transferase
MGGYAVVLLVAALVTLATTPLVRWVALRTDAVVYPDARHVHEKPMPTLGGVAMWAGFVVAMAVASQIPQFRDVFGDSTEALGVVIAATVILVVGALDDLRDVSPPAKVAGQALAGSILYLLGVTMYYFRVPFADFVVLSPDLAPLVTVVWVVLMANAVNLIDGLDGLAAGIVAIAGSALFLFADRLFKDGLLPGSNIGPLVAIIAVGVCLGFLPWNFHPAKIFMGDAGALFLGLLMAASTMVVGGRTPDQFSGQTFFFFAPLVIPFVVLGVPFVDAAVAVVRRAYRRAPLAGADRDHLHHRLVRLGHGHRRAVLILWVWTALLAGLVLAPTYTNRGNALVPFCVGALALALYILFHPGARAARRPTAAIEPTATDDVDDDAPLADVVGLPPRDGVSPWRAPGRRGGRPSPGSAGSR